MTAATGSVGAAESQLPGADAVLERAGGENFSVASVVLGRKLRTRLTSIYGFARLVDQLGDAVEGDRLAHLDWLEAEVERVYGGGAPQHPLMQRLAPVVRDCNLPRGPFLRLIDANRRDQERVDYRSFSALCAYCDLSANPVGELVLHVFGAATEERIRLSDRVCTALQLVEHWQDVGEDFRAGRIYLPAEDRARFGVGPAELGAATTGPALRELLAFEVDRARALLDEGAPLVGTLRGRARLAVAGYVGGGRAALSAIEAAGNDVLAGPPKASSRAVAAASLRTYARGA
jgi:squalene synthase HpnC